MKYKNMILLIAILIVLPSISAASISSIGPFKQGDTITIPQTVDNSTFCNLTTLQYPNSTISNLNLAMTKSGDNYLVSLNSNFSRTVGNYNVCTKADPNGIVKTRCFGYDITVTGDTLTSASATINAFIMIIAIFLFILSLYGATKVQWKDNYDFYSGSLVSVSGKKYMKIILLFIAYLILLFIFSMANDLSASYLFLSGMNGLFKIGYFSLLVLAAPLFLGMCIFLLLTVLTDKKIQRAVSRGIPVRR